MASTAKEEKELVTELEDMFQSALEHPAWKEWRSHLTVLLYRKRCFVININLSCRSGGMADAPDSKSGGGNPVGVQVPPPAPTNQQPLAGIVRL